MRKLLALTLLLSAPSAWAYIPPSQFIVKSLAARHAGIKTVRIRSTVTAYDSDKPTSTEFKAATVYDAVTGVLRSTASDDSGKALYVIERKASEMPLADALIFDARTAPLVDALREASIPVRTDEELAKLATEEERYHSEMEWLTRWHTTLAWVIGSPKPEKKWKGQLWVEKDSFLPLRALYVQKGESDPLDVRFENYRFQKEFPYPRAISLMKNDQTAIRDELIEAVPSSTEPKELKTPVQAGFTDAGNSASSAIRDLIQRYYQTLR